MTLIDNDKYGITYWRVPVLPIGDIEILPQEPKLEPKEKVSFHFECDD